MIEAKIKIDQKSTGLPSLAAGGSAKQMLEESYPTKQEEKIFTQGNLSIKSEVEDFFDLVNWLDKTGNNSIKKEPIVRIQGLIVDKYNVNIERSSDDKSYVIKFYENNGDNKSLAGTITLKNSFKIKSLNVTGMGIEKEGRLEVLETLGDALNQAIKGYTESVIKEHNIKKYVKPVKCSLEYGNCIPRVI